MTQLNRIEGIIRLTSPLHCASPDASLANADKNETPTHQQRVITKNSGIQKIPYFPGNDLRGRLRRKAAALVLDQITAKEKVSVDLYAGLNAGAITASPDSSDLSVEEALRARDNVYMGLFGGGARLLRSRYRASDMIPVLADTIDVGMVPKSFGETGETTWMPQGYNAPAKGWELIETIQVLRVDDVMRVMRPDELLRYIDNATQAVASQQAQILEQRTQRKEDKAAAKAGEIKSEEIAGKRDIGNVMSFQAIRAGAPLHFLVDLSDDTNDAHIGLMLLALQALVREQALGGWVRAGLGRFNADLQLTRNGMNMNVFKSDANGAQAELSESLQPYVCAAQDALSRLTAAEMMDFFTPRATAAKPAKSAKKSAAAQA